MLAPSHRDGSRLADVPAPNRARSGWGGGARAPGCTRRAGPAQPRFELL
jgi:hypothetical protein